MKSQKVNTRHDSDVWKRSISYVTKIYELPETFPSEERFGLISQIRRSAISIPSNIAEGAARRSDKEFLQFLYISLGSVAELETQLIISNNLKFVESSDQLFSELNEIKKMTLGLIKYVKSKTGNK